MHLVTVLSGLFQEAGFGDARVVELGVAVLKIKDSEKTRRDRGK